MKITNADIIKNGERDLIDAITADLDWGAIEEIFLKEHNLGIEEDIEYKSGDIIAIEDQIAYKLEFEVKVKLSIILDRNGDYISVAIKGKHDDNESEEKMDTENGNQTNSSEEIMEMESKVDELLENINKSSKTQ
jgi:hypothetical protein